MNIHTLLNTNELHSLAQARFQEERDTKRLDGWFLAKDIAREFEGKYQNLPLALQSAKTLREIVKKLPISISEHAVFAGTQNDSFARSYALINPAFKVESFTGYCDPTAVFDDISPNDKITAERIADLRDHSKNTSFVRRLSEAYEKVE